MLSLDDFDLVLERSKRAGVQSMIMTGGSLTESQDALNLAKKYGSSNPFSARVLLYPIS